MIKRYIADGTEFEMREDVGGEYITYEDHAAEVARLNELLATTQKEGVQLAGLLNGQESAIARLNEQVRALAAEGSKIKEAFKALANTAEEADLYGDVKYMVEPSEYDALSDAVEGK